MKALGFVKRVWLLIWGSGERNRAQRQSAQGDLQQVMNHRAGR